MGRRRTQLTLTAVQSLELTELLKRNDDLRIRERLRFVKHAVSGRYTLEELAGLTGRSRSTIQNWLGKFLKGGLPGLLERDAPPGRESPLAQPRIQKQLAAARKSGRIKTAADAVAWLEKQHGVKRARKSVYYWLRVPASISKRKPVRARRLSGRA
jgi:transposase